VNRRITTFAGGALLIAFGIWYWSTFERAPTRVWAGSSGEARLRQFLAAERFAERMGLRAAELRSLPQLDAVAPGGVLLMPNRRQALELRRLAQLVKWVEGGGHLIVEAERLELADPLFDLLGVRRAVGAAPAKPLTVELPSGRRKLTVAMYDALKLEPREQALALRVGSPDSAKLVSFELGKGMVSAATNLHFARNGSIGQNDHAEFLWELLQLTPARELQVYFQPQRLSLWGFLGEHAAPVLAAAAALLLAWLWRIGPRFGPVVPDTPPARRRLLDHLRASGRYYWSQNLRSRLVVAARDAALRRMTRAHPDFAAATSAERAARLAELAGISHDEAARLLVADGELRGAAFIQIAQHAQRVHSALEKGKR
jgi:hypothetical protein